MKEISVINGVQCYEVDGIAFLDLEAVARGLGFTQEKNGIQYSTFYTKNLSEASARILAK